MPGLLIELAQPVRSCAGLLPAGHRGHLRPTHGWGLYDLHVEVPLDGIGVPLDAVLVVVTGDDGVESRLSLRDWSRLRRRALRCRTCRINVLDPGRLRGTMSTPERREKCGARRRRLDRLGRLLRAALDVNRPRRGVHQ